MLGHDPCAPLKKPVDIAQLKAFYQKWYTPDAMTLIVVGNVDSRSVAEQINKTFGELKGKRETPAAVPTLAPLPTTPVSIMTVTVRQDKLSIMWDSRGSRFATRWLCSATGVTIWRVRRCSGMCNRA